MTRLHPINTASAVPCAVVPVEGRVPLATYSFREDGCDACSGFGYTLEPEGPGYVSVPCDECEGTGEADCACADCGNVYPLNDEGLCERCFDSVELPIAAFDAKYLGKGMWRVEL